jgi:hypothetical protein
VAKCIYRAITPVCRSKAHAAKKSYSENEMCEKWRKYECANIDNAECPSSSAQGAEGCYRAAICKAPILQGVEA